MAFSPEYRAAAAVWWQEQADAFRTISQSGTGERAYFARLHIAWCEGFAREWRGAPAQSALPKRPTRRSCKSGARQTDLFA